MTEILFGFLARTVETSLTSRRLRFQGWPKWVLSMVTTAQSPPELHHGSGTENQRGSKILLTGWGPINVTIPAQLGSIKTGGTLSVDTDYPFGDSATIRVQNVTLPFTLSLRIPGWATEATLSIYGSINSSNARRNKTQPQPSARPPVVISCTNGTYQDVEISAGSTILSLDFRPQIRLSYGWGPAGINAVAVMRGPLLYALPLEEHYVVTGAFH